MKRIFLILILLCLLVSVSDVFASVAIYENGTYKGEATAIDIAAGGGVSTFTNGERANLPITTNLLAIGLYNGSVTEVGTGLTALPSAYKAARVYMEAKTLTLANGIVGQVMLIEGYGATANLVLTATTKTGWTTITLDTEGDSATLLYLDNTLGWMIVGTNSVSVGQ